MTVPTRAAAVRQKVNKTLDKAERTLESSTVLAILIVFSALLFSANLFLTFLAQDPALSRGLFKHTIANVSAEFPLNITPAGWTFSIWGVIYLFQAAWILYSLGLLCRRAEGGPAYLHPMVLSPAFFIFFIISTGFAIGWLFLWDRYMFLASFVFLGGVAVSLVVTVGIGAARLSLYKNDLIDQGRSLDVKVLRLAMVNGISMYATWTTIATLINLGTVLVYKIRHHFNNEDASIVCLSFLSFFVVVYVVLDLTALDYYNRWNLTPYLVVIWALVGVAVKNYNPENVSSLIGAILIGAVSLSFLVKVVMSFMRSKRENYAYRQMKCRRPQ